MKIREFGVRGLGLVCALIAAGSASQHAPATALNADLAVKGHTVVNINAAVSGYYQGVLTSPVTLKLGAGCYQITDGFGKDPAALYDAFNYHLGVAADWAWQYRVVNLTTSATLLYVAAPSDEAPATMYATEAAASAAGQALLVHTFCLEAGASVGFVVDDNYVPDNTGGISLLISDPIPLDRLTLAGPTVLTLHNAEIRAWEGYSTGDSHPVYYSTFNGKSTSAIEQFPGAETTVSPALGSARRKNLCGNVAGERQRRHLCGYRPGCKYTAVRRHAVRPFEGQTRAVRHRLDAVRRLDRPRRYDRYGNLYWRRMEHRHASRPRRANHADYWTSAVILPRSIDSGVDFTVGSVRRR